MEEIKEKNKKGPKWLSAMYYVFFLIIVLLIVFLLLLAFVFSLCGIKGSSMNNTLSDGQYVLLQKSHSAKAKDIIVFENGDINLIKRVIAVDGDSFAFVADSLEQEKNRTVSIYIKRDNGFTLYEEDYICAPIKFKSNALQDKFTDGTFKVYLADNPEETLDIPEEYIITVPKDHLFVLGDNRNNSWDSRKYGFIEREKIFGKLLTALKPGSFAEKLFLFFYGEMPAGEHNDMLEA